jgi:pyruvate kinase
VLSADPKRRTAIVATLGPSSSSPTCVADLIRAGMDVVRLSMGNATPDRLAATARLVRRVAAEVGRPVRLLADLQARKNRLGSLPGGAELWQVGDVVTLCSAPRPVAARRTWMTHPWTPDSVGAGATVLVDDGAVALSVLDANPDELRCTVTQGGAVTAGRGVTIPGATVVDLGLTERDTSDLAIAVSLEVELVALSFACSASDYHEIRALAPDQVIIGKVEHPTALAVLPALAQAFDGLMVARGDLALEIPFEDVPFEQRRTLAECARHGKVSMVATQLLHSMRRNPTPTRAEVSDVATAVLDGAQALVVTGETGYGAHPVRVVEVLHKVIVRAEAAGLPADHERRGDAWRPRRTSVGDPNA